MFDLVNKSGRAPMTKPGDKFYSEVKPNGDRVSKYRPGDSDEKYTEIRHKYRTEVIHSFPNKED